MLENLVISIHAEATHQRRRTTRRYAAADGSKYVVTLPNWRWRILDQRRPDAMRMKSLLDLVLASTAAWRRNRPDRQPSALFKACLEDRVDVDAAFLRTGSEKAGNENFRTPWFVRIDNPGTDNHGGQQQQQRTDQR